jgi:hypothetical protein
MILYLVRFSGPFGFIKPWTAVRDGETFSQAFLTPSIVEGMRQKLEVSEILRHRLHHDGMDIQQEQTQTAGWEKKRNELIRARSILKRGILLNPVLTLAFPTEEDAVKASIQHLCLCRNEDVLLPCSEPMAISLEEFEENEQGIELLFGEGEDTFCVGRNRFNNASLMYGRLHIVQERQNG